jgi:hypothetical protein
MDQLTVKANEVRPGDIAFEMVVTDIGDKHGRPKLLGIGIVATTTQTHSRKAITIDSNADVTVERPRFQYSPRSRSK